MVAPLTFWLLFAAAMLISSIGFYKYVYFISLGYGFSIAGLGALMLFMFRDNLSVGTIIACVLFIIYGIRLGGYLLIRALKSAAYRNTMKTEIKDGKKTIESFETKNICNNLCNKQTLDNIRASLLDVVWDNDLGTAAMNKWRQRKAQSDLVKIAGKTGTAQVIENGKYLNNKHRMSFVGYFPADAPRYTCICVIHAPRNRGAYDSGLDCGSVVRKIAEKTIVYTSEFRIYDDELVMMAKED
jgi:hypothetical protein